MTEEELKAIGERRKIYYDSLGGRAKVLVPFLEYDVPALVAEVRRLRAFVEEHAFDACMCRESEPACIGCHGLKEPNRVDPSPLAHAPDCELVALLGREPQR